MTSGVATVSVRDAMPWVVYPMTILGVLTLHQGLIQTAQPLLLSGYLPVLAGAVLVTLLEWRMPERGEWRPTGEDVRNDTLYMLAIQIAVPKLLGLAAVLTLLAAAREHPTGLWSLWPHEAAIGWQAVLMVLTADFFRYWLHRAAHETELLWRFHAVHHSPPRLYWLNVGRFHPVDKALQFLLDSLPFMILGVSAEVVTLYFVFYAVNGFFQHSNVRLRFGWLNYLISTAELHRWHHSRQAKESNTNYGNNTIIWDLLFGTWFLPQRAVGDLGLVNRAYPRGFWSQLRAPFTPDILYRDVPLLGPRRVIGRWLAWAVMKWVAAIDYSRLRRSAQSPEETQERVRRAIVAANAGTRFGKEHGFERMASYAEFVSNVPVQEYEGLRPYVLEQEAGLGPALTQEAPFMYAVTSGTTGEPKYIPVLRSTLAAFAREQRVQALFYYRYCPMAFTGKVLTFSGPKVEGHRPSGMPIGSISGQLYANQPSLMRVNNVVPPAVYDITTAELKYQVMATFAAGEPRITQMIGANPSSFLRILEVLSRSRDCIADCVERGSVAGLAGMSGDLALRLDPHLQKNPQRARMLRTLPTEREPTYVDLWPEIRLVSVWTGGSCGVALEALKGRLPEGTRIMDLGYLATELRGSITVDGDQGTGVPTLEHHYFEFIEPERWEAGERRLLRLHELRQGVDYYVVVTTGAGLYRYFMNDIVRVTGRFHATPTIRFLQKGRGVTNITGEKVYEGQILEAIGKALQEAALVPVFVMALADEDSAIYRVFVEAELAPGPRPSGVAEHIDASLARLNQEYAAKRDSGRLAPLQLTWLNAGTGEAYKRHCLEHGQREGQFKTVALQYQRQNEFAFDAHAAN